MTPIDELTERYSAIKYGELAEALELRGTYANLRERTKRIRITQLRGDVKALAGLVLAEVLKRAEKAADDDSEWYADIDPESFLAAIVGGFASDLGVSLADHGVDVQDGAIHVTGTVDNGAGN